MNSYQKALELGLQGTNQEIVDCLKTLGSNDVLSTDISVWMREKRLWIITPDGNSGILYDLYKNTDNQDVKNGLAEWYASTLGGQAHNIKITDPSYSIRIFQIISIIILLLPEYSNLIDEFYSLCGGRPYSNLTVEQFITESIEAQNEKIDPEWTDKSILLSVNIGPQNQSIMLRVSRCAVVDGIVINGPVISTVATAKAANDPRFVGLLAEVQKLTEALSNG